MRMNNAHSQPDSRPPSDLEHVIQRISRTFYSRHAQTDWIPSDEADVFRLRFDDLDPPRILKIERSDRWVVRREQLAFPRLRAYAFREFPEVEFTQADWREQGPPFMLMPETRWRPLHELWDEDQSVAVAVVRRMGRFLSRLSSVDWRDIPGAVSPALRCQSSLPSSFGFLDERPWSSRRGEDRVAAMADPLASPWRRGTTLERICPCGGEGH
jgi:hypothetical protein